MVDITKKVLFGFSDNSLSIKFTTLSISHIFLKSIFSPEISESIILSQDLSKLDKNRV
jgi:hypothetical protein